MILYLPTRVGLCPPTTRVGRYRPAAHMSVTKCDVSVAVRPQ